MRLSGQRFVALLAVAFGLLLSAQHLAAQQMIRGVVLDNLTLRPIPEVEVILTDEFEQPKYRSVRTDTSGVFVITPGQAGRYRLLARRIGYAQTITPSFVIREGEMNRYELIMDPNRQILAPLTIVERPTPISNKLEGFEWRRIRNAGTFFTKEQIDMRGPLEVTDLLMNIAGMRISQNNGATEITMIRAGSIGDSMCSPVVYIDGIKIRVDPVETLNMVDPQSVYGVEVYKGVSQVPGEFAGSDAACGAIVVWTRRGD